MSDTPQACKDSSHNILILLADDSLQAIVDDILQELGQAPKQLVDELEYDLVKLINKHSFMGVRTLIDTTHCSAACV